MTPKQWKNIFGKFIVGLIILLNAGFAYKVLCICSNNSLAIPDALIYCWFGFTTGELAILAGIKRKKITSEGAAIYTGRTRTGQTAGQATQDSY